MSTCRNPHRHKFAATGEMQVPIDGLYVPRTEVDDRTWNRLLGDPHARAARLGRLNRINLPTASSR